MTARASAAPARRREPAVLLGIGVVALCVSAIGAKSLGTWFMEVLAALIAGSLGCAGF
jgi:putative membrane protein